MKPSAVFAIIFLLNSNISSSYRVRRSTGQSLENQNDPSNSLATLERPEYDLVLQKIHQKITQELDQQLSRTLNDEDKENATKTSGNLKLFFPGPPSGSLVSNGSLENESFPLTILDRESGDSYYFASERSLVFHPNLETSMEKPFHQPPFEGSHEKLENDRRNDKGNVLQNISHSADDEVDTNAELTIKLSKNDENQLLYLGNNSAVKNVSTESIKTEETGRTLIKTELELGNDLVLNHGARNLNPNIRLMPHNRTDAIQHAEKHIKHPDCQRGARSLNPNMNTDNPVVLGIPKKNTKNDANKLEISILQTRSQENPIHDKEPSLKEMTEHPLKATYTIKESKRQNEHKSKMKIGTQSDSLEVMIQNLTMHYQNRSGRFLHDAESFIRNITKVLPRNGQTPEEKNFLHRLSQYLSGPNLFSETGFPKVETLMDFESFLEIVRNSKQSKLTKKSGFYPLILEYLNIFDFLFSGDGTESEEESWSNDSALFDSFWDYFLEVDDNDKLKPAANDSDNSWERESIEWTWP